jgi:diphthamide synthase (EF-2-diphthine--ammonia ligase)
LAEKNSVFLRDAFEAVLIAVAERSLRERRLGVSITKKK